MAEVKLYDPTALNPGEWFSMQRLARDGYRETLDVSDAAIDALVGWNRLDHFITSHVDPQSEVGARFNPNQIIRGGVVALAIEKGILAGWGYAERSNVSYGGPGGPQDDSLTARTIRNAKLGSVVLPSPFGKNYFVVREVIVRPDQPDLRFRRRGIGTQITRALLGESEVPWQPVAAYDTPEIDPEWLRPTLVNYGFKPKGGTQSVNLLGRGEKPVEVHRLQANSAWGVSRAMQRSHPSDA